MGFFDKIFGASGALDERQQAIVDVISASVLADGRVEEVEMGFVLGAIAEMIDGHEDDLHGTVEASLARVHEEGTPQTLARCAEVLDEDDRVTAFKMAIVLQYIDGEIAPGEDEFVAVAAEAFGFSDDEADDYVTDAESFYEEMAAEFDDEE